MLVQNYTTQAACRRGIAPACDPVAVNTSTNPNAVDGKIIYLQKGDILDVGIDWSIWFSANGGGIIKTSTWAAHVASPQAPNIVSTTIDHDALNTIAILDTSANAVGDTLYISNTVVVSSQAGQFTMPDRTITRHLVIKVSA